MESFNSEMMLFQPPVVNHGIEYLQWIECRPVNQITEDGSIDIHLKASGSQYLDLQRSRLYVKAKIVNENGDALETTYILTPVFRNNVAKCGAFIDMVGPIYAVVFQMPRYLLNEVDVHVKLFQNKNSFRLLSSVANKQYKVVISEVMLKAAMIGIHADILKSHARALEDTPALYPLLKTEVKTFAVGKGLYNVNLDDIYQGKIPNRLILVIVSADAYAGDLTKNPFNFKHYNFEFICLYANGQSVPSKALQPKFASNNYVEAFQTLLTGMAWDGKDAGLQCSRFDYAKGYTLVVFDLSSEVTDAAIQAIRKQGNLQLEIRFASALPEAINVILYASFPGEIKIDQARSIQVT